MSLIHLPSMRSTLLTGDPSASFHSRLLSSLWVSCTGSASDWCALQEALYKCIDTYSTTLHTSVFIIRFLNKFLGATQKPCQGDQLIHWCCIKSIHINQVLWAFPIPVWNSVAQHFQYMLVSILTLQAVFSKTSYKFYTILFNYV